MELPKVEMKLFEGKVKDILKEMKSCQQHMMEHYPFEDSKVRNVPKEMKQIKAKQAQMNQELSKAKSKETQDKLKAELKVLQNLLGMLNAINDLDGKIFDLEDMDSEDVFYEEIDIFIVISLKEEHKFNALLEQCKTQFRVSLNIPTSFEKSLITINYCLALLCKENLADEFLGLNKREQRLERLREEMKKVLLLMEREKISDNNLRNSLNRTASYFISNVPSLNECKSALSEMVTSLKQIRPFFFQEFFDIIEVCDKNSEIIKNKTVILLLGSTGSGKSTTLQYLSGANMKINEDGHIEAFPMPQDARNFIANQEKCPINPFINPFEITYKNNSGETENIYIVDTPGFGESQAVEVDISNSIGIIKAVQQSKKVYPVIIFNEQFLGGHSNPIIESICFYSNMINCMTKEESNSINFFFSHHDERRDLPQLMRLIIENLNAMEQMNLNLVAVLKNMRALGEQGKLLALNPLDGMSGAVLKKIFETDPIDNPSSNFNLFIKESSKISLQKQIGIHEQFILDSLYNKSVEPSLICHKIHELQKFAQIIEPYDKIYKERVKQLQQKLINLLQENITVVNKRIKQCLDHDNKLSDQDIASIKEALEFQRTISLVLEEFNQQDDKSSLEIQYYQPQIVQSLLEKCDHTLFNLWSSVSISDDKWFVYMEKTGKIAQQMQGCENVYERVFQKYTFRVYEQSCRAEEAIKVTNIRQYSSGNSSESMHEESKKEEQQAITSSRNHHEEFANSLINLMVARDKAKNYKFNKIAEEIEKTFFSAVNKVNDLDKIIQNNFVICGQDFESESYIPINAEHINNINLSFKVLNSFQNSCNQISLKIAEILSSLSNKYCQMCIDVLKALRKKIKNLLEYQDQTQEIKEKFAELLLMRNISNIQNEAQVYFNKVYMMMENHGSKKKVIENLNELCNFAIQSVSYSTPFEYKNGIEERLKSLNDSLKSIKILEITYNDPSQFKEKVMNDIIDEFNKSLDKISREGDIYGAKIEEKNSFLEGTANFYELIQQIFQIASDHNIDVKKDYGFNCLKIIKRSILKINSQSNKFSGKLMVQADYRYLENQIVFLQQFTEGIVPKTITKLLKAIQINLPEPIIPPASIDPNNIIAQLDKLFPPQLKILTDSFDELLKKLKTITTVLNFEERKIESQQFQKEVQELAEKILKLFKIAYDLKRLYPKFLYKILEQDHPDDEDFILNYFSKQFRDHYLIKIERQKFQGNRLWIYLKLESMRYLKDVDAFMIPPDNKAQTSFKYLDEKYFLDYDEEVQKAKEKFKLGEYSSVADQLDKLQTSIIDQSAQEIIKSIKQNINLEAAYFYESLQNQKDKQIQLTNEAAKFFQQNIVVLLKINISLGQFIIIKGENIIQIIESQYIAYLEECLMNQCQDIDITLQAYCFSEVQDKIDSINSLARILRSVAGNEVNELQRFQQLIHNLTKQVNEKQLQLFSAINEVYAKIISRDIKNSARPPQAKVLYSKISEIKQQSKIILLQEKFIQDLLDNYDQKCVDIQKQLEESKNANEIENIKKEARQLLQSLKFMPDQIKDCIEPKINEILEIHDKNLQDQLEKKDQDVQRILRTNIDPIRLSNDYLTQYNDSNSINIELKKDIKNYLQKKVIEILKIIKDQLNENKVEQVLSIHLPLLMSYMNDSRLSEYIFHDFIENQQAIKIKINKLVNEAIILEKY